MPRPHPLSESEGSLFHIRLSELSQLLLQMATYSEEMVEKALDALKSQNISRARVVVMKDKEIDALELAIDRHIFEMVALQQPVASDLRLLLSAQKINNDLERIADHAVNIAEAAIELADAPHIKPLVNIPRMAEIARSMLKEAIDSFVYRDAALAAAVKRRDDEIDELYHNLRRNLAHVVEGEPKHFERAGTLLAIGIDLERIADLATNIAEEVIFITNAEIVKHKEG
jgi:phosphate transport system protein